jgi:inward rectifier potassium channel
MSAPRPLPTYPRAVPRDGAERPQTQVEGLRRQPLADVYYRLIRAGWARLLAFLILLYVLINALFALAYVVTGGIEGARPGSYADAFFFSVQTMATIGYGAMYPKTPLAHALVTIEALIGMLGVAMSTGILFSKFARPVARVRFSDVAVITRREGVPNLLFRVANERTNHVVEATMKLYLVRNEKTAEGESVRRWHELALSRNVSPVFALTWTVFHPIDEASMLRGATAESLAAQGAEILAVLTGLDATLASSIHARFSYVASELRFGHRFVDIFVEREGRRGIDLARLHETVPE